MSRAGQVVSGRVTSTWHRHRHGHGHTATARHARSSKQSSRERKALVASVKRATLGRSTSTAEGRTGAS